MKIIKLGKVLGFLAASLLAAILVMLGLVWMGTQCRADLTYVSGKSMLPTIQDGQMVETNRAYPFALLRAGDIVVRDGLIGHQGLTTHRLMVKRPGGWITQGDNNLRPDMGLMSERHYIGVVRLK